LPLLRSFLHQTEPHVIIIKNTILVNPDVEILTK
jgi:hypothetical protein